jgi:hypothetical protein
LENNKKLKNLIVACALDVEVKKKKTKKWYNL